MPFRADWGHLGHRGQLRARHLLLVDGKLAPDSAAFICSFHKTGHTWSNTMETRACEHIRDDDGARLQWAGMGGDRDLGKQQSRGTGPGG